MSENQTISEQGGKVIYSSTDEKGNVKVGDEFTIKLGRKQIRLIPAGGEDEGEE